LSLWNQPQSALYRVDANKMLAMFELIQSCLPTKKEPLVVFRLLEDMSLMAVQQKKKHGIPFTILFHLSA
jgi:hypothetical protein